MVVILTFAVMRGAGVEVVLGGGLDTEQYARIDAAMLGLDDLDSTVSATEVSASEVKAKG